MIPAPFLRALWPAGLCWVTDRLHLIHLTVPGRSAARRGDTEAALTGLGGRAQPVQEDLVLADGSPVLQGTVVFRDRTDRELGFGPATRLQQAMEKRGYLAVVTSADGDPAGAEPRPPMDGVGPFTAGDRVEVLATGQRGTVMNVCRTRGCLVRLDLVGRQRKPQAHEDYYPGPALRAANGPSRLAALRALLDQGAGRTSFRDAELYARALGLVPPEQPPLFDDQPPPLRYALGDLWRALRAAPPPGYTALYIDTFFERNAETFAAALRRPLGKQGAAPAACACAARHK